MLQMWTNHWLLAVSAQIVTSCPETIVQEQVICNSCLETLSKVNYEITEWNEALTFVCIYLILQPITQRTTHMIFIISQIDNVLKCFFINLQK